jgi:hypothetical protein
MGAELPGPWGGFAMVLALGLPPAVGFAIAAARRPWGLVPMTIAVFWPALLWLSRWLGAWA